MTYAFELGASFANRMDSADPLRKFREHFYISEGLIYMDGNSLGLCSLDAEKSILGMLEIWKEHGINMWSIEDGKYFLFPSHLAKKIAPLIGAEACEVTVANSTTVNIHQAFATLYKPVGRKNKIVVDGLNFPTDRHAVDSQVRLRGLDPRDVIKVVPSEDGRTVSEDAIIAAMTDDVCMALLPSVYYRSSQLLDMKRITDEARKRGIIMGWDLCHSIGSVPHDFADLDADFAVWCNYKYLSGGPGAAAGLYVNKKHFGTAPGLAGWQGNVKKTLFELHQQHEHSPDADGWLIGTPPMLAMAGLDGVLNLFHEAGMPALREKSLRLTAYLMFLIDKRLTAYGYAVGTPRDDARRGGHVALEHNEAYRICKVLKNYKVVPDFRDPNVIRLAPTALYNSYADIHNLVDILEKIGVNREYENLSRERSLVV